ncbi:MAG: tetratricopeptide repeat protein [Armatimonadota bacterium]
MPELGQDSTAVTDGVSTFKEGRYTEAIPLLKDLLASNPNDIQVRTFLAASYSQTGSKVDAIMEFIKLTELEPGNAQHYFNLGVAYEGTGNLVKAKESFEKTVSLNPNHPKASQRLNAIKQQVIAASNASPKPDIQMAGSMGGSDQGEMLSAQRPSYGTPPPAYNPQPPQPAARPFASEPVGPPPGLNWGGLLLPVIWSMAHGAWLWAVISFFFGMVGSIYLLIKGNEVAFQNRQFSSMDEFRAVQKAWTVWGIVVNVAAYVFAFIFWGAIMAIFMGQAMNSIPNQGMPMPPMPPAPGM